MTYTITGSNIPLHEALREKGATLALPCAGGQSCGKCGVWVKGAFEAPCPKEQGLLARLMPAPPPQPGFAFRLACFTRLDGTCQVILPDTWMAVELETGCALPAFDGVGDLGMAIDIGTTTVAAQLYDLPRGTLLASLGEGNEQAPYGADVLSRIAYSDDHGASQVSGVLQKQIASLMRRLTDKAVSHVVVTGNTAMLHFAAGLNPHGIGQYPFAPESLFGQTRDGFTYPPCISAYVGADTVSGMLAAGFDESAQCSLLVDVGTNGEIALLLNGEIYCCATAAGPAFEGAHIRMGMAAQRGAISRVYRQAGATKYETIGGVQAMGLCGTGLISAVRVMLETGLMDETGAMAEEAFIIGDSGVALFKSDIRALQLAKAAIAAGIDTLLHAAGIGMEAVDVLLLAGGFGNRLNPQDAAAIGLIPKVLAPKAKAAGNLALAGAVQMLFAESMRERAQNIAKRAQEVPLAAHPVFSERYIEHMLFPEADHGE